MSSLVVSMRYLQYVLTSGKYWQKPTVTDYVRKNAKTISKNTNTDQAIRICCSYVFAEVTKLLFIIIKHLYEIVCKVLLYVNMNDVINA